MRKLFKLVIVAAFSVILYTFFIRGVAAADVAGEYTVREDGGAYILSRGGDELSRADRLRDLFCDVPTGATVMLESIYTDEELFFCCGEYTLLGRIFFLGEGGITVDGASVTHSSLSMTLESGAVRIKRGDYVMESGSIISENVAIRLDGFASARFLMTGGSVKASSYGLFIEDGSARILGGSIMSTSDSAIIAFSELVLADSPSISGVEHDVTAGVPITLYDRALCFSSSLRVRFLKDFKKGEADVLFYARKAEDASGISVFSLSSVSVQTIFMDGCIYSRMPYKLTLMDGVSEYASLEFMPTDALSLPLPPERAGYEFVGWYTRDEVAFDPGIDLCSDMTLYAKYKLCAPTFSVNSESFTYDSEEHLISITDINHPSLSSGTLSFAWYKDGVRLSSYASSHAVKNVSDSGEYYAVISFTVGTDTVRVSTPTVKVDISRCMLGVPTVESVTYSGRAERAPIAENEYYRVSECVGTEVGVYPLTLTLKDPDNYGFVGVEGSTATVNFHIVRAENRWISSLSIRDIYTSEIPQPTADIKGFKTTLKRFGITPV